jgi:hypothetical protein
MCIAVETFERISPVQLGTMLWRERHVGEHVLLGSGHEFSELGGIGPKLIGGLAPLTLGSLGRLLCVSSGDEGRDDAPPDLADISSGVAREMHAAPLPRCAEHPRYGCFDAFVGI